jgi:hypothetical protein
LLEGLAAGACVPALDGARHSQVTLTLCKCLELRLWPHHHPLRQFESLLSPELLHKLEDYNMDLDRWAAFGGVGQMCVVLWGGGR